MNTYKEFLKYYQQFDVNRFADNRFGKVVDIRMYEEDCDCLTVQFDDDSIEDYCIYNARLEDADSHEDYLIWLFRL